MQRRHLTWAAFTLSGALLFVPWPFLVPYRVVSSLYFINTGLAVLLLNGFLGRALLEGPGHWAARVLGVVLWVIGLVVAFYVQLIALAILAAPET